MYSITEFEGGRILSKLPQCRNIFTSGGKLIEFGKKKSVILPKDTVVSVNRVLHWELKTIRQTKDIQALHHNANIQKYNLSGGNIVVHDEEVLLSSLEVIEVI